ncbi:MAG: BLUF domain-containing protein [Nitrospirota bacterium]|nr:BLUF domain-containing protein [Nitrospirota bacterium]MDH4361594.1 BLUF domain-containing protein [Nitrospirota bacterium]MDH5296900.1 BLUF domain-containing protein [Nitrospirota bacterium]MDH5575987.1 BLUF domain-containing protein [Nitrospirota bacterium]
MENDLYQIIYASAATRPIEEDELMAMLKLAREKNTRLGITGMLLHCDGSFIQALEGPKDRVMDLLRAIRQDPRHSRIEILFEGPIKNRNFSQWSMGFSRPSKEELARIEGYTPFLDLGNDPKAIKNYSSVALKLIAAFRELSDKKHH